MKAKLLLILLVLLFILTACGEVDPDQIRFELNPGIDTVVVGNTWTDASISTSDNSNEAVSITVTGFVNTNFVGSYMITYTLEDTSGNQSIVYRWVYVIENVN